MYTKLLEIAKSRARSEAPDLAELAPEISQPVEDVVVFTFRGSAGAEDAAILPRILRITLRASSGEVVKVSLSKTGPKP